MGHTFRLEQPTPYPALAQFLLILQTQTPRKSLLTKTPPGGKAGGPQAPQGIRDPHSGTLRALPGVPPYMRGVGGGGW